MHNSLSKATIVQHNNTSSLEEKGGDNGRPAATPKIEFFLKALRKF
jgi:hypothetical protein